MKKDFKKWHNEKSIIKKQMRHIIASFVLIPPTTYYSEHYMWLSVYGFLRTVGSVNAYGSEKTYYLKYYEEA